MSKINDKKPGYGKILDYWMPSEGAGDPVGCIATSYTFSPVFFEEECLGRFLQLETDPKEDGPLYIIEREEKISGLVCASALVDQHHCRGSRSLRWDMISARVPRGILHAKVSLLHWTNLVRVIVASANLTEDGYRHNQEIFGVIDYAPDSNAPLVFLTDIAAFLRKAASYAESDSMNPGPAVTRWNVFLDGILSAASKWGYNKELRGNGVRINAVFSGFEYPSVFKRLREVWPDNAPPKKAYVISPFFDKPGISNRPAIEIWNLLNQRGDANVTYDLLAKETDDNECLLIRAPESLMKSQPSNRNRISTHIRVLKENNDSSSEDNAYRPLHLKNIWIENDSWVAYMIGSSNFTSAGFGLHNNPNLEANLVYLCKINNSKALKNLSAGYLDGEEIDPELELRWEPIPDVGQDSENGETLLNSFFGQATYCHDEKKNISLIEFSFGSYPPFDWVIRPEGETVAFYSDVDWKKQGSPPKVKIGWTNDRPPSGFEVNWKGSVGFAWWPVNVLNSRALPPPAKLRDLPLEALINILTSARPLHQAISTWLKRNTSSENSSGEPIIDPHKRIDTSSFLLQRTRRVSRALVALRERLERPMATLEILDWRLHGPVGPMALYKAIAKEAKTTQERSFLIAELALELSRVKPQNVPGYIEPTIVKKEIRNVINELNDNISFESIEKPSNLKQYVICAIKKAIR